MKKFVVSLLSVFACFMMVFTLGGCSMLDKILGNSEKEKEPTFDRTPYIGTYYFSSKTVVNKTTGETTVYEVGDQGYTKEYMKLEMQEDYYRLTSQDVILSGDWDYSNVAGISKPFNFYANGGVLAFSASIEDGAFTREINEYGATITIVLVKE